MCWSNSVRSVILQRAETRTEQLKGWDIVVTELQRTENTLLFCLGLPHCFPVHAC